MNTENEIIAMKEEFREECTYLFSQIENALSEIEHGVDNPESIPVLFRAIHTIKGTASFMDLHHVTGITHSLESLLQKMKNRQTVFGRGSLSLIFQSVEVLKAIIFENDSDLSSNASIQSLLGELKNAGKKISGDFAESREKEEKQLSHEFALTEIKFCQKILFENKKTFAFNRQPLGILMDHLKVIKTISEHSSKKEIYHISSSLFNIAETALHREMDWDDEVFAAIRSSLQSLEQLVLLDKMDIDDNILDVQSTHAMLDGIVKKTGKSVSDFFKTSYEGEHFALRIIPEKFDRIFFKLKKLEKDCLAIHERLKGGLFGVEEMAQKELIDFFDTQIECIQNVKCELLETRRIPLLHVFKKFVRIVEHSARVLNKEIELEIIGGNIEVDKSLELIHNSLVHILRNSCDHGIEYPHERESAGKPRKGKISVEAYTEKDNLIIKVTDDGRGISLEKIKQKAIDLGFYTRESIDRLEEQEVFKLIYKAGFTTADKVSQISGRGVGMDVVISDLQKLNGTISLYSKLNQGTTTTIQLPLIQFYDS